jgi:Predicted transcriptional regulator
MKISSRFSIAVHIIVVIALMSANQKITSVYLSKCINVNPVIIRKILGQLKKAKLIDVKSGEGGATLLADPNELSLIEIYRAVEVIEDFSLFNSHNRKEAQCPINCKTCPLSKKHKTDENGESDSNQENPVGCIIHFNVDEHLLTAQKAMEESLKGMTIGRMIDQMISGSAPKD